jgi:predicted MPP superfamily phosphohydrolase
MRRASPLFFILIFAVVISLDIYIHVGISTLLDNASTALQNAATLLFWSANVVFYGWLIRLLSIGRGASDQKTFKRFTRFMGYMVLLTVPKIIFTIFHLIDDLVYGIELLFVDRNIEHFPAVLFIGAAVAGISILTIIYGIIWGKFKYRVLEEKLSFSNLPDKFNGTRIAHISDIHIGSFENNHAAVEKAIQMLNDTKPDYIFFTGDLVNNHASEMDGWVDVFSKLEAKKGKYSILGNHDYGDYARWDSPEAKVQNLDKLKGTHREMGFNLLLNQNDTIRIDDQEIAFIGVENWGVPPFKQYGNLNTAKSGTENIPFKILLSHDPSHWDEEVKGKEAIDLTLSGHTHGMQFGFERFGIKWSPVQLKYKKWGGLFQHEKQYLYINRGFGFIGFPGRVGIFPEITLIELQNK